MTGQEIAAEFAVLSALRDTFWQHGMRLLPERENDVLAHLRSLGVTASIDAGYLALSQGSTQMVLSAACETVRKQFPQWFVADPRRDAVSCREDLERGTLEDIAKAKSAWIKEHGIAAWTALPQTKAEAEKKSVTPDANMNRAQYLSLPFAERVKLSGILGPDVISKIMRRVK